MAKVCVIYGFGEGPRVGRRFRAALESAEHEVVVDPGLADVLVTHSGGHLLVPGKLRAGQIIHIAPYYWPGKTWAGSMARKLINDFLAHRREKELGFWARKTFWNFTYACKMPSNLKMLASIRRGGKWRHGSISLVVRPRHDDFCTPRPEVMPFKNDPTFLSFPGHHDDCWRDPTPYISLIKS